VTVRRLLSHSAGVPLGALGVHYAPGAPIPPLAESLSGDQVRLVREPGSAFEYSNAGYAVLELLVEEVTGRDFAEYMEAEVLIPLGMRASSFAWREEMRAEVPTGYDLRGRPVSPFLYPNRASGGLFATLGDVGRFVAAGMLAADAGTDPPVLSRANIRELYTPQISLAGVYGAASDAYGLGHFIETLPGGEVAVWHGGQGLGWMTHFHSLPEQGDGIVMLTNSQRSWPFIASVLDDWSRWRGFGPVGMSRIVPAQAALRTIIGWILLASIWCAWRVGQGVSTGRRRPSLRRGIAPRARLAEMAASLVLLGVLLWSISQEYLFISSIFPDGSVWLGASLLLLSVVLPASALLPVVRREP
jgi:CubicO group peptidase (beta-lactamase class C family)